MKKILLFGGRSLLGGHICRALLKHNFQVIVQSSSSEPLANLQDVLTNPNITVVSCRLTEIEKIKVLLREVEYVIYSAIPYSIKTLFASVQMKKELNDFANIVAAIKQSTIKKAVFVSVCGTVATKSSESADENFPKLLPSKWRHIDNKTRSENVILDYAHQGAPFVIVNPSICIGEHDTKPSTGEFFKFIDKFPFTFCYNQKTNIVDVRDVGEGTVLALEKGTVGERYLLTGNNIYISELIARIKKCGNKRTPTLNSPVFLIWGAAYLSELLAACIGSSKPLVPILGIQLILGITHYSNNKAKNELGYSPRDAWAAVDIAYAWYKNNNYL